MLSTNLGREPLPNAVLRASQRSIDIAITVRSREWITGTMIPPLKIVPQTSVGCSMLSSAKCDACPNHVKNTVNATIAQTKIIQNAPLTPWKP